MEISQIENNVRKGVILFLHLLVMASALFSFPGANEKCHSFEDFVQPSHFLADKMIAVNLQKPMISLVLLCGPVALPTVFFT